MTGKEFRYVLDTIENEGLDYAFHDYSDFQDIDDPVFHSLRYNFLFARKSLAVYVGAEI